MIDVLPDIPRVYTAISEWLACIILILAILPDKKRPLFFWVAPIMGLGQIFLQLFVENWSYLFWIPGMILNVSWMLLTLIVLVKNPLLHHFYILFKAFIFAEFIASFSWQLYVYLLYSRFESNIVLHASFILFCYTLFSILYYFVEKNSASSSILKNLRAKDTLLVLITALIIFTMSNIGFILSNTSFAIGNIVTIFLFRSLINLCGLFLIFILEIARHEDVLKEELSAMNNVFQSQYEQYKAYRETNEMVNQKFHDLKHQLDIIEMETDPLKRQTYVNQIKEDLQHSQSNIKTGNPIADVILTRKNSYCIEHNITFTCIVDGALLNEMNTMDLVSLLGNGLDNAIESSLKLDDFHKRLIKLRVSRKAEFVIYSIENYTEDILSFEDGLPKTTKKNKVAHGYGLKSTAYIAEKYNGSMTVKIEDNWFKLNVLLPLPRKSTQSETTVL